MRSIDILGKKFGRLIIVEFVETRGISSHAYWKCKCICGNEKIVRAGHLKNKIIKSCGCLSREKASKRLKIYANSKAHKGQGNPAWKGDEANVSAIHNWLARFFKKKVCEKCGNTKTLDWALKTNKKYSHNRKNFIVLCRSCHFKYDYASGVR